MEKAIRWNELKNERLKKTRGLSFEELLVAKLVAVKTHPQNDKQRIMLFDCRGYLWVVPFVENESDIFLKTLYPSRKYTKLFREGKLT